MQLFCHPKYSTRGVFRGVLWVLEHPPQSLAQTLKATASGPPQSTDTGPSPERTLSLRYVQLYQQNKGNF